MPAGHTRATIDSMPITPKPGTSISVLVVEGEPAVARQLARALTHAGFRTTTAPTATRALALVPRARPDLVLVDLSLPDGNGHDLCEALRRRSDAPIVMLAPSVVEADRDAWSDGADDYIFKPITYAETIARIRAVLRRAEHTTHIGPLEVDDLLMEARLDGRRLQLSHKELELLLRLARAAGTVVTREQLMHDVWDTSELVSTRTVDVHVGWLRKKLGDDPADPRFIHTVRGVGFRLASAAELAERAERRAAVGPG